MFRTLATGIFHLYWFRTLPLHWVFSLVFEKQYKASVAKYSTFQLQFFKGNKFYPSFLKKRVLSFFSLKKKSSILFSLGRGDGATLGAAACQGVFPSGTKTRRADSQRQRQTHEP